VYLKKTTSEELSTAKKDALNTVITKLKKTEPGIDDLLKMTIKNNIQRLIDNGSYRRKTTQSTTSN